MVIFDDADPEQVAEAIRLAGYWNSGQDCTAGSRVLVGSKLYDRLLEELVPAVESLKVGDPAEGDEIEMGPVISQAQQERVLGFLERATAAKATILTGGGTVGDRGFFVRPTVVTDVAQDAEIVQDEVFGPVVTVQRFESDDEAIAMANDVRYGLAASVFTRDVARALNAARQAPVRHGLGQRPPAPDHLGDAARRLQGVGLRQGHVHVLRRGVHAGEARRGEPHARRRWPMSPQRARPPRRPTSGSVSVTKRFDDVVAVDDLTLEIPHGSFFAMLGPSGLRQDDDAADDRRVRGADGGRDLPRRPRGERPAAVQAGRQHRLPELRALPAPLDLRERRLRPAPPGRPRRRDADARRGDARARRPGRARAAQAAAALGRPAAAGRGRPRARQPPARAAARRAARSARPQAAQADAAGAEAHPERGRDHLRPRDARPGRGDDDGRHDRRHERRPHRAAGRADRAVRAAAHGLRRRLPRRLESAARRRLGGRTRCGWTAAARCSSRRSACPAAGRARQRRGPAGEDQARRGRQHARGRDRRARRTSASRRSTSSRQPQGPSACTAEFRARRSARPRATRSPSPGSPDATFVSKPEEGTT